MALYTLDIETTGLDRFSDSILCIGLYSPEESLMFRSVQDLWSHLETNRDSIRLIMHSGAFDYGFLKHQGLDIMDYWAYDTKTIASILCPKPENLGLEPLCEELLGLEKYKLDRDNIHEKYSQDQIEAYCLEDCARTYQLFKELVTRLVKQDPANGEANSWQFVESWVMPATKLAARMEYDGILVDVKELKRFEDKTKEAYEKTQAELQDLTQLAREHYDRLQISELKAKYDEMYASALAKKGGKDQDGKIKQRYHKLFEQAVEKREQFSFNSPKQVLWLLKDYLNLNVSRSRDDKESTGVEVLSQLASEGNAVCESLLAFRKEEKRINASIPAIYDNIKPDGCIHPRFHVGGTRTGRLSSSNPNIQQVERGSLRKCLVSTEGNYLVTIDYAQIEVRIMAELSREPRLFDAFNQGIDPYSLLVKSLFPFVPEIDKCPVEEIKENYPKFRDVGKTAGLSIFYGTGARKLSETIQKKIGLNVSPKKAGEIISNYRSSFPYLWDFKESIEYKLSNRKVVSNLLGRPIMIESNEDLYMKGMNTIVQGSASDLVVDAAANEIPKALKAKGVHFSILALVHDEIVLELPDTQAHEITKEIIEPAMTAGLARKHGLVVPLKVEYHIGRRWEKARF